MPTCLPELFTRRKGDHPPELPRMFPVYISRSGIIINWPPLVLRNVSFGMINYMVTVLRRKKGSNVFSTSVFECEELDYALSLVSHLSLTMFPRGWFCLPQFADGKAEAQKLIYPRPYDSSLADPAISPSALGLQSSCSFYRSIRMLEKTQVIFEHSFRCYNSRMNSGVATPEKLSTSQYWGRRK